MVLYHYSNMFDKFQSVIMIMFYSYLTIRIGMFLVVTIIKAYKNEFKDLSK